MVILMILAAQEHVLILGCALVTAVVAKEVKNQLIQIIVVKQQRNGQGF